MGYHAASLVTDFYVKGYRDFDVQEAYRACLRAAEYDIGRASCRERV